MKAKKKKNQTFIELEKRAEQIRFGTYDIRLFIHKNRIMGFDQLAEPIIKFRESKEEEKVAP